tara:strand:+ start:195 stop:416 length:222 start_codon:yes stop_codon:yes gene_type:complete
MAIKTIRYDDAMFFWQDVERKLVCHTELKLIRPPDIFTPLLVAAKIIKGRFYLDNCYPTLFTQCDQINSSSSF